MGILPFRREVATMLTIEPPLAELEDKTKSHGNLGCCSGTVTIMGLYSN